jgi:hypothetical protein
MLAATEGHGDNEHKYRRDARTAGLREQEHLGYLNANAVRCICIHCWTSYYYIANCYSVTATLYLPYEAVHRIVF